MECYGLCHVFKFIPFCYYLPGHNHYLSGTIVDVDGHCVGKQPYLSSTGHFQQPVVHESEALPCYSSTAVVVQNETVNGSVIAKSDPISFGLAKQNSLKYRNGSLTSTLSKTVADTKKDIKVVNKVTS